MASNTKTVRTSKLLTPWIYRLPKDLEELASVVGLSVQTLTQMIDEGQIPVRVKRDSLGRSRGRIVWLPDVRGLGSNPLKEGGSNTSPLPDR